MVAPTLVTTAYGRAAAAALHEFVTRIRFHLVALMRLVDICVDGALEATMYEAQAPCWCLSTAGHVTAAIGTRRHRRSPAIFAS